MGDSSDSDHLRNPAEKKEYSPEKTGDYLCNSEVEKKKSYKEDTLSEGKKDFDLALVSECFTKCRRSDGSLSLEEYLRAYHELCRFFKLMGRLFGFVAEDLQDKISTLELLRSESPSQYDTIQSLVEYEVAQKITHEYVRTKEKKVHSGSRQLLRLHRALEFILEFMRKMAVSPDDAKTSDIAAEVYEVTLAKHHVWIIRKMARFAMFILPKRRDLIQKMCKQSYEEAHVLVDIAARNGQIVYDVTQKLLEENCLLDIP